jgi:4-diphosphocytidyl-2-C-methyl-D-erythritol kinase
MKSVRIDAPAKVNLRLKVLARETTGYHSLETVLCGISLCDSIVLTPGGNGLRLEVTGGIETGPVENNLIVRAARRFFEEIGRAPDLAVHLEKRIPSAAGLGGGSSDAAATLRALNAMHHAVLGTRRILEIGTELGSDVPFFLVNSPLALGWARGHRLLALEPLAVRSVLVARPDVDMPTPLLFRRLSEVRDGQLAAGAAVMRSVDMGSWDELSNLACNDFEAIAPEWVPEFGLAIETLKHAGASIALLAGSGSSIFGIFEPSAELGSAESALQGLGFRTWRAETLQSWPEPRSQD